MSDLICLMSYFKHKVAKSLTDSFSSLADLFDFNLFNILVFNK